MMNDERTVKIPVSEYERLVVNDTILDVLIDAIYKDVHITWDRKDLSYGDGFLKKVMPLITGGRYTRELNKLIAKKEQEDEEQ